MCFAGCLARVLIVTAVKMPWSLQHLFWYMLCYSRVAAAGEPDRLECCMKAGARVKNRSESFKADCRSFVWFCLLACLGGGVVCICLGFLVHVLVLKTKGEYWGMTAEFLPLFHKPRIIWIFTEQMMHSYTHFYARCSHIVIDHEKMCGGNCLCLCLAVCTSEPGV